MKKTKQKTYPNYLGRLICSLFADEGGLAARTKKSRTPSGKLRMDSQLGIKKVGPELRVEFGLATGTKKIGP